MIIKLGWKHLIVAVVGIVGFIVYLQFQEPAKFYGDLNESVTIVRDGYDLPALKINRELNDIATLKCQDMIYRDYFDHKDPTGKMVWERYNFGKYNQAGENLAFGFRNAQDVVESWKNSTTHLANLRNAAYKEVGYAVCLNNDDRFIVVQVFRG